jgi:hypothetical protein
MMTTLFRAETAYFQRGAAGVGLRGVPAIK